MVIDNTLLSTSQLLSVDPLIPSKVSRAAAQQNVTAVTVRAVGYASMSEAWAYND